MENFKCPICEQEKIEKIILRQIGGKVAKCAACGHLSLLGEYKEEVILAQYNNSSIISSKDIGRALFDNMPLKLLKRFDKRKKLTVLDVGCGLGELMKECVREGHDVQGLEITKEIVEQLNREGLTVHNKTLDEFSKTRQRFDWVTCLNLIEHLNNPSDGIEQLAGLVKEKGMLVIETPNGAAIDKYAENAYGLHIDKEHLNYFKPDHLAEIFSKYGFSLVCKKYYPLGGRTGRASIAGTFNTPQEIKFEQTYRNNDVPVNKIRLLTEKLPPAARGAMRSIMQLARYTASLDEVITGNAFQFIIVMKRD